MKDAHYASAMERETAAARGVGLAGGRGSIRPQGHNRLDAGSSRTESNENLRFGSPDSVVRRVRRPKVSLMEIPKKMKFLTS
jgi:hypothetical protein